MSRRLARELALKVLFQMDVGRVTADTAWRVLLEDEEQPYPEGAIPFARELVEGVRTHLSRLDHLLQQHSVGWSLARMPNVDRNILRMAVYELCYRPDIPANVSINEAIELAKRYSEPESGRFINGVLGALSREIGKPGGEPVHEER
ncbi:MAG: transcription antitermination factor NusB [Firmicutes bacterium]|nr:transcription antitermination factor NusB [Bacillota bacterium]